jgi:hypothetical protein
MRDFTRRLNRVEKALGAGGDCRCGPRGARGSRHYFPEDGEAQPCSTCEKCGGAMVIIKVVYEKPDFPNYDLAESVMYE